MKVFVTGAAGYLGSTLVPLLLREGCDVLAADDLSKPGFLLHVAGNPRFRFHRIDVTDPAAVEPLLDGCDAVVHLAAVIDEQECRADESRAYRVNARSTEQLARLAPRHGLTKMLFVSTASIYGAASHDQPATETTKPDARTVYAKSKLEGETGVLGAASSSFTTTVFRFASLMGVAPVVRYDGLLNRLLLHAARDGTIPVRGDASWRPCLHVGDAAGAIYSWLARDRAGVSGTLLNVGQDNYQKRQLAKIVAGVFPRAELKIDPLPNDRDYCLDFSRSREIFGDYARRTAEQSAGELERAFSTGLLAPDPNI
jgi:nucleoside-diphosphate-sugar epimerase